MRRDWPSRVRDGGNPASFISVTSRREPFAKLLEKPLPGPQPDETARARYAHENRAGRMIPLAEVVALLDQRNLPPQLRQTLYVKGAVLKNTPVKILEENSNRMSFLVFMPVATNGTFFYSYGFPSKGDDGNYFGVPISVDGPGSQGESNGTVSIDAIWVFWQNTDVSQTETTIFGCYEGVLAIESHLHNQTRNLGA